MLSKIKRRYRRRISVSKLVEQLWCEKKLELKLLHGIEHKTREMREGEMIHKKISYRENLPRPNNFIDWLGLQLHLSDLSLASFRENGHAREVFLVASIEPWEWYLTGSIDEIRLLSTKSQVVEVKTTRKGRVQAISSHRLQVMLYQRMLNALREQDYSENVRKAYGLRWRDAVSESFAELAGIEKRELVQISSSLAAKIAGIPKPSKEGKITYVDLNSGSAIGEVWLKVNDTLLDDVLSFARSYWTEERGAIRARERWKCRYCEVRNLCNQNIFI